MSEQTETETAGESAAPKPAPSAEGCYRCGSEEGSVVRLCKTCQGRNFSMEEEEARIVKQLEDAAAAQQSGFLWWLNNIFLSLAGKIIGVAAVIGFLIYWVMVLQPKLSNPMGSKPGAKKSDISTPARLG